MCCNSRTGDRPGQTHHELGKCELMVLNAQIYGPGTMRRKCACARESARDRTCFAQPAIPWRYWLFLFGWVPALFVAGEVRKAIGRRCIRLPVRPLLVSGLRGPSTCTPTTYACAISHACNLPERVAAKEQQQISGARHAAHSARTPDRQSGACSIWPNGAVSV
jgi:hypothetical protein